MELKESYSCGSLGETNKYTDICNNNSFSIIKALLNNSFKKKIQIAKVHEHKYLHSTEIILSAKNFSGSLIR